MGHEIVVGLHFYQPPREATHPALSHISTDPEKKNWTAIIEKQCYQPLALEGTLNKVSFDIYQSLLLQLEKLDPQTAQIYERSMTENGVGEAFIHPILPDLSSTDKQIVISAGVKRFQDITGLHPKTFWPPETAIDTDTLETLAKNGYESFICAPEQVIQSDGSASDNRPTLISLPSGRQIIALPFDRALSTKLAFDPKTNADRFAEEYIKPKNDTDSPEKVIIAWTDAETFGHHFPFADKFLNYLLDESLPRAGLYPVSINDLQISPQNLAMGQILERSSWSCPHENLIRWSGTCGCSYGQDSTWKAPFYAAMCNLNDQISQILYRELGHGYPETISENFYNHYAHPETVNNPSKALIAAKISSLVARTSCATFFSTPEVSGKINLLYVYQTLLYLQESGLTNEADKLKATLTHELSQIRYPNGKGTALSALEAMLKV
jgi:hypothetical protein